MEEAQRCKILLLGESAVGKTSLFKSFFSEPGSQVTPTIGVEYKQKIMDIEGQVLKVQIWDTAGSERFRTVTPIYYRRVDGAMLVFDLSDASSFRKIDFWVEELSERGEDRAVMVLVGNKSDIAEREVSEHEGKARAEQLGIDYVETSSRDTESTMEAFHRLIHKIWEKKQGETELHSVNELGKMLSLKDVQSRKSEREGDDCC